MANNKWWVAAGVAGCVHTRIKTTCHFWRTTYRLETKVLTWFEAIDVSFFKKWSVVFVTRLVIFSGGWRNDVSFWVVFNLRPNEKMTTCMVTIVRTFVDAWGLVWRQKLLILVAFESSWRKEATGSVRSLKRRRYAVNDLRIVANHTKEGWKRLSENKGIAGVWENLLYELEIWMNYIYIIFEWFTEIVNEPIYIQIRLTKIGNKSNLQNILNILNDYRVYPRIISKSYTNNKIISILLVNILTLRNINLS